VDCDDDGCATATACAGADDDSAGDDDDNGDDDSAGDDDNGDDDSIALFSLTPSPELAESIDDLVWSRGDQAYYKKFSDKGPFTGEVTGGLMRGVLLNGKMHGPWVVFYENGLLNEKGEFKNGKREGLFFIYSTDGFLVGKGDFRNGKKEGLWRWLTEPSEYHLPQYLGKGHFKNGKREGPWVFYSSFAKWDDEGGVAEKGEFKNGPSGTTYRKGQPQ